MENNINRTAKGRWRGQLYRVETSYFVCGLIVLNSYVVETTPIMAWAEGRRIDFLEEWVTSKGGTLTMVARQ